MKTFYWLVKREFWEHRGGFLIAPAITAAIIVVLSLMGVVAGKVFGGKIGLNLSGMNLAALKASFGDQTAERVGMALDGWMLGPAITIMLVLYFVVLLYCINTLMEDRRDRSVLFWKSLPISDRDTVLSKVFCAGVLAPAIAIATSIVAGIAMLLVATLAAASNGIGAWQVLWTLPHPFRVTGQLIASLPLYLVWALPSIGWLLLCSAWAKSRGLIWAVTIPLGSGIVVGWFNMMGSIGINTSWYWKNVVARVLLGTLPGSWIPGRVGSAERVKLTDEYVLGLMRVDLAQLYTAPFLIGAACGIAMIALAIWLRRWRTEV